MMNNVTLSESAGPMRTALRRLKQRSPLLSAAVTRFRAAWAWMLLLGGLAAHGITGKTPKASHLALVRVFVSTRGMANDVISGMIGAFHRPYGLPAANGVLGKLDSPALAQINLDLELDGYRVFENCLSSEFCDRLLNKSLKAECLYRFQRICRQCSQSG